MNKPLKTEIDEVEMSLSDCVEHLALCIAESVYKEEKRANEIQQNCKILDSLSNALMAIKQ